MDLEAGVPRPAADLALRSPVIHTLISNMSQEAEILKLRTLSRNLRAAHEGTPASDMILYKVVRLPKIKLCLVLAWLVAMGVALTLASTVYTDATMRQLWLAKIAASLLVALTFLVLLALPKCHFATFFTRRARRASDSVYERCQPASSSKGHVHAFNDHHFFENPSYTLFAVCKSRLLVRRPMRSRSVVQAVRQRIMYLRAQRGFAASRSADVEPFQEDELWPLYAKMFFIFSSVIWMYTPVVFGLRNPLVRLLLILGDTLVQMIMDTKPGADFRTHFKSCARRTMKFLFWAFLLVFFNYLVTGGYFEGILDEVLDIEWSIFLVISDVEIVGIGIILFGYIVYLVLVGFAAIMGIVFVMACYRQFGLSSSILLVWLSERLDPCTVDMLLLLLFGQLLTQHFPAGTSIRPVSILIKCIFTTWAEFLLLHESAFAVGKAIWHSSPVVVIVGAFFLSAMVVGVAVDFSREDQVGRTQRGQRYRRSRVFDARLEFLRGTSIDESRQLVRQLAPDELMQLEEHLALERPVGRLSRRRRRLAWVLWNIER